MGRSSQDSSQVCQHLNNFYVNVASQIGGKLAVGQHINSTRECVTLCIDHFRDYPSIQDITRKMTTSVFSFHHIAAAKVERVVHSLDPTKATGVDRIPAKVLRLLVEPMSHHLASVFNQCIEDGRFPDSAKLAEVVPLLKKDDSLLMKNCWPVSILTALSKIFERLMLLQLTPFMEEILHPCITAHHHGYSCQSVLDQF